MNIDLLCVFLHHNHVLTVKEQFKKFGFIFMIALFYLSNTGLLYHVHTCLHTGISVVELPQILSEEDHCPPMKGDISCSDKSDDCCKTETKDLSSCHKHTLEYKKADIVSVKPEFKVGPILDCYLRPDHTIAFIFILPATTIETSVISHFESKVTESQALTGLQQRIHLSSFIC